MLVVKSSSSPNNYDYNNADVLSRSSEDNQEAIYEEFKDMDGIPQHN